MYSVEQISLEALKPYENNPRINDKAVEAVANSIREFGFNVPIVIDRNNVIIAGHTRFKASKLLGITHVPCYRAENLTDEQVRAFRLADNKTAELAEWDFSKLEEELKAITMDMTQFDFDLSDLNLDGGQEIVEDDVPEVDEVSTPTTKRGQLWRLGDHLLMCGDSTEPADVERLMQGERADLLVTDPPYNVAYQGKTKEAMTIQNDNMDSSEFRAFLTGSLKNAFRSMKEGSSFYIWYASREHINFEEAVRNCGEEVRQVLIWNKSVFSLSRQDYHWKHEPCLYGWKSGAGHNWYADRKQSTVMDFDKPLKSELHPTMKPVELIAYQIGNSSKKGDIVLDLFGGSGTTLIACEQTGRKCRIVELDEKYCDVIIRRWENLTGGKAVLVDGETAG